ncbi:MAG: SAM-dependent methyltransferase [Bacteroidales bacterium]|nr:SAM-dependent methyltransferase [Clostridium sp.]MCM1203462.1 SAM-dependent methyltransferase [Bacteroidales bacterium]
MLDEKEKKQISDILAKKPDKLVLSNPADVMCLYKKIVIQKIALKGKEAYQIERFTDKQAFHENVETGQLEREVGKIFPAVYKQLNIFGEGKQWDFKITKKGKLLFHGQSGKGIADRRISIDGEPLKSHNRKKNYLLKEGTVIPPLVDLGIFTKEGKVVRAMYDKYKQINRFLELVEDAVKDYPDKELHIIDFGCGKSYLTFILYYYLVELKGRRVQMTGLDLKEEVIRRCNDTAEKYRYEHLHFERGDINGYHTNKPVDMVVTLHACDTATDYALYNAVSWNAGIILSVPCCQHEINAQVNSEDLSLLTKYGIVKERVSALMTDAIRANVLEYCGYRTQLLEFIDFTHSPKNILIRAVKGSVSQAKREKAREEIEKLCAEFGVKQTLAELVLGEK